MPIRGTTMATRAGKGSAAASLEAALVVLASALCVAEGAAVEDEAASLRGGGRAETPPGLLIPADDVRRTTDPLEELWWQEDDFEGEDDAGHRELLPGKGKRPGRGRGPGRKGKGPGKGKRRRRKFARGREQSPTQPKDREPSSTPKPLAAIAAIDKVGACADSRPAKCGCPEAYQSDYRGWLGTSQNGFPCRAWGDVHPDSLDHYPDDGLDDGAVCRNPGMSASRAWCFVDAPRDPDGNGVEWDYCDVRTCGDDHGFANAFGYGAGATTYGGSTTTGVDVRIPGCVDGARYDAIDADVAGIAEGIADDADRVHFIGGVLRLAAHDFMDYDQHNLEDPMGMDGCIDWMSLSNLGLSDIWNEHSALFQLHRDRYSDISRPDFWVAAANAIVRQTSVDHALDLRDTYYWGRREAASCPGSADRLPSTEGCRQVEAVFLERMGMKWKDAVALLGAHTVGRGHSEFSGHHGKWVPNDKEAQVFDKRYFEELVSRSWTPRVASIDPPLRDWTTGDTPLHPKMMLNTDICLLWDIEDGVDEECCTRTDLMDPGTGRSRCEHFQGRAMEGTQCGEVGPDHPRAAAAAAVRVYLGGRTKNDDNSAFYHHFKIAWFKATLNGMRDLKPLMNEC